MHRKIIPLKWPYLDLEWSHFWQHAFWWNAKISINYDQRQWCATFVRTFLPKIQRKGRNACHLQIVSFYIYIHIFFLCFHYLIRLKEQLKEQFLTSWNFPPTWVVTYSFRPKLLLLPPFLYSKVVLKFLTLFFFLSKFKRIWFLEKIPCINYSYFTNYS